MTDDQHGQQTRRLAAALEPFAGQVYFSPECHAAYEALGFAGSPHTGDQGLALPDGAAYFTSRGSILGQVPGTVVAAAFGVFNPVVVVAGVSAGWALTDATTIAAARDRGAIGQLSRVLGEHPDGIERGVELLTRATDGLRPEGRALYAGLTALPLPDSPLGTAWRLADMLREYRGDSHTAAWISAGLDAVEIGLLSELYWGLPMRSYIRTRAWSESELDAAQERLAGRGLLDGAGFSAAGRELREDVERTTDRQCLPIVRALGDDADELIGLLQDWSGSIRAAAGYPPQGPHDLAGGR
ncbi:MAG TPA: hypothetical protein VF288_13335 [Mycobacteriales bacterium]